MLVGLVGLVDKEHGETKQIKEHEGNRTDLGGRRLLELVGLVGVVDGASSSSTTLSTMEP